MPGRRLHTPRVSRAFPPGVAARALAAAAIVLVAAAPAPARAAAEPAPADPLPALIAALGDDDYHRREAAAAELKALGPAAIDALLAAAETSGDLEIALKSRWLVESIPLEMPHDPPEVVKLLARFKRRDFAERVQAMHRLLRVDDDAGIEPLARVARLDPSPAGSRVAAALLAREWQPDDPAWPGVRRRIAAGLGPGTRPTARFLAALVAFTGSAAAADRDAALASAAAALADLATSADDDAAPGAAAADGDERVAVGQTRRIFARCHVRMLATAGRREAAHAAFADLVAATGFGPGGAGAEDLAHALAWAVEAGLAEAAVAAAPPGGAAGPLVDLAAAHALRSLGRTGEADARHAAAAASAAAGSFTDRLQATMLLAKWGCTEWAVESYDALLAAGLPAAETALTAILYSEFLHDLERDDDAAGCLRLVCPDDWRAEAGRDRVAVLEGIGRDPRAVCARLHFFEACGLARRGDAPGSRSALERALAALPKDVDALIALHARPDNTPEQRADAARRVKAAAAQIEAEIQAVPDDPNGYNEYAWLVANTEGDAEKATRYSKLSLVRSFDNASYLDTLAHCHAAAGRREAAVRTQRLAQRQEPHNRTIAKNLARFEAVAR